MTEPGQQHLLRQIRTAVETVLGREADPQTSFFELGLTSLALTRVRLLLQRSLGRPLADTALFDHSSVAALAAHLAGPPPAPDPAPTTAADGNGQRIAVIGMAARFPGAPDVDTYWRNLREGVCAVRSFAGASQPGHVPVAGVLDDIDRFDAAYFGMSAQEAGLTDPAHRLFLEVCQQALEHGGYAGRDDSRRIGVYAGTGMNLYGPRLPYYARHGLGTGSETDNIETRMQGLIGAQHDFLATRVAYRLSLTGAAVGVQSACSTSLVAVHLAAQSLLTGENDLALAGAAAVQLPQDAGYDHEPGFILSPSGVCRAFDAASDGTVGGNGVAAVLLKRLDRALADGDEIQAVLLGSAVNNDGDAKAGFTAPGVRGHTDAARRALARAGAAPETVSHVEAHGTGTALGDRVEFEALSRAYRRSDGATGRCALGSVKPALGHLDTCAGMAGLLKTVLMLRHRTLVPTVNHTRPDPRLPWQDSPFRLVTRAREWTAEGGGPRRAGVSALGFGGTNAHVILEEPPARAPARPASAPVAVPLSAHGPVALRQYARRLRDHLRDHPGLSAYDLQTSLAAGRPHLRYRAVVHGSNGPELADALDALLSAPGEAEPVRATGAPVLAFSGQGVPAVGAALGWYHEWDAARSVLDTCEEIHRQEGYGSLLDGLLRDPAGAAGPDETPQAALFALQMAQARLWRSLGVEPAGVLGHSLGELAALCDAGAFSIEDGLRFTAARGRAMATRQAAGRMLAVAADPDTVAEVCAATGADLAAANGPRSHVLSGTAPQVDDAQRLLEERGLACRELPVGRAFHSSRLAPVLPELREAAAAVRFTPLHTPCGDTARGAVLPVGTVLDAEHLVRQARQPVLFAATLAAVRALGCADFVEIGPGDVLTRLGRVALPGTWWAPSRSPGTRSPREALAALYGHGVPLDWARIAHGGRRVALPGRPFLGERFPVPALPPVPGAAVVDRAVTGSSSTVPRAAGPGAAPDGAGPVGRTAVRQLAVMGRLLDDTTDLLTAQLRALPGRRTPRAGD
ncbi:acyltransferase domain-containing protein [Streptomyces sp. TM32]|uniref:type I polyketide synthase n=1 Tax=Streptomyces sp. TM32 TaxID=1652669 RepID=UPI0010131931|nr:type I polyketide synthase [Streptomyces sp. TM32]RXS84649.1 acyltransferase domain-containing protein [Streptomyces sp. TM32]